MFEEFLKYVNNFDISDKNIKYKYEHSKRVYALSIDIAKSINLPKYLIEIAGLIGLLHDIGRFTQWEKYKTFKDNKSIDHGLLGVDILFKEGNIRRFISNEKYDEIIKASILYHNDFKLLEDLDENTLLFCKIVRDADKIDILENETKLNDKKFKGERKISEKVLSDFLNNKCINFEDILYGYDSEILRLSLLFDINYKYAFIKIKENGYVEKLLERIKDVPNIEIVRNKIINYLDEQINKPKEWYYVRKTI